MLHFQKMAKEEIANKGYLNRGMKDTKGDSGRCLEDSPGVVTV